MFTWIDLSRPNHERWLPNIPQDKLRSSRASYAYSYDDYCSMGNPKAACQENIDSTIDSRRLILYMNTCTILRNSYCRAPTGEESEPRDLRNEQRERISSTTRQVLYRGICFDLCPLADDAGLQFSRAHGLM